MTEADFQTRFGRWVHAVRPKSFVFELKITDGVSIPFSALSEHQERALWLVRECGKGVYYKIPDVGPAQKPFDGFWVGGDDEVGAYVVVMFYKRGEKGFYMIRIDEWINEKETSTRKSLTEERAGEIGQKFYLR
jgi:hypothetical protein